MIATQQDFRTLLGDLTNSAWTLATLGVLFESGLANQLREPRTLDELSVPSLTRARIANCLAVAASAGVVVEDSGRYRLAEGVLPALAPPLRTAIAGDIRSHVVQPVAFLDQARGAAPVVGWRHSDPSTLQAQGDASTMLAGALKLGIAPQLGDLAARLDRPGARMLDVGTGVASLAIALCRTFPQLSVVGLDIADEPLALARRNVAAADLGARVELRKQAVEALTDDASYDVAWVPQFFLPEPVLAAGLARVLAALRPGGWALLATMTGGDARERAVGTLLGELWGGSGLAPPAIVATLERAGFADARVLPSQTAVTMIVGRRA